MPRPEHLRALPERGAKYETPYEDATPELTDVPAAIVCAHCGSPECTGCLPDPMRQTASGVLFFVPWERPDRGPWGRFWDTTRATTHDAEVFFSSLPDGSVGTALVFAIVAEVVAVGSTIVGWGVVATTVGFLLSPAMTSVLLASTDVQLRLGRVALAAWFVFSLALVVAHALHGWTLDRAARRAGAEPVLTRALRFGLYAAGWDVATSPFGLVVSCLQNGLGALRNAARFAVLTPTLATAAFVRSAYHREPAVAISIRRTAMLVTLTLSTLLVVIGLSFVFLSAYLAGR